MDNIFTHSFVEEKMFNLGEQFLPNNRVTFFSKNCLFVPLVLASSSLLAHSL